MASTLTLAGDWLISLGSRRMSKGTGNLGTYATGGIAVSPAQAGLGVFDSFLAQPAAGYVFEYDASAGKVKAYVQDGTATNPLAQVSSGTNLAGITFNWQAFGR